MIDAADVDTLYRARALLAQCPIPAVRGLTVNRKGNALLICGRVQTYYHKQMAQEAVMPAAGKLLVVNDVDVRDREP